MQGLHDRLTHTIVVADATSERFSSDEVRVRVRRRLQGAEVPARRQGREPRRDDEPRPPRTAGLHDQHRRVQRLHEARSIGCPKDSWTKSRRRARRSSRRWRKRLGDADDPLLVSVRSGAPFSMPGMMDTVLNLGLNDDSVKGLARADAERALRVRLVPPVRADVRQDRARRSRRSVRGGAARPRRAEGPERRHRAVGRGSRRARRDVQGDRAPREGRRVPDRPAGAVALRDRSGVQVVERQARAGLPPVGGHPRRPRHRGQRADDGVRQQGRRLGHRRRVHAQPVDR